MAGVPQSDEQLRALMARAQEGDGEAYVLLLRTITPWIRRHARRQHGLRDASAVEDVVQDVLLSLHAVRATYDRSRPFLPWLAAIVRRRIVDAVRHEVRRGGREVVVGDLDVTFEADPANNPVETSGDAEALRDAIQTLPAGQRRAIELLKLRELSLKEASEETGLSVGALKLATHRAMASLRRALRGTDEDED
jgi:RNA polymerase sigma-70 factor (ECF subfamily)